MFSHLFATMNELLDELIQRNPNGILKGQDEEQFSVLKAMSDKIMDEWLSFEEKIALFNDKMQDSVPEKTNITTMPLKTAHADKLSAAAVSPVALEQLLSKGQGYFKLYMFPEAADAFNKVMEHSPDCNLARLFLAMTYMHMQEWYEAQRHFQLIVALTDHPKWQALG